MTLTVARVPCASCPYRRDVPSGVWAASEYDKLPGYDGTIPEQLDKGATALFDCHQRNGKLCAGWVGCHGAENLLAFRLTRHDVDPAVLAYESPVPLWDSGAEAAAHGKRDIRRPGLEAVQTASRIRQKRLRKRKNSR